MGGVLEHPYDSSAWATFGLPRPDTSGGWIGSLFGGWACHVEQGHYGHRARKATWLYAFGTDTPSLMWGPSPSTRPCEFLCSRERAATPAPFRDLLLSIARTARVSHDP